MQNAFKHKDAFEHCERLVREADRARFLATLFALAEHRPALFALYAFDIETARVRERSREPMPGEIRLQWWREVLAGERAEEGAAHPVASALLETLRRHDLRPEPLIDLLDARGFDLYDDPMGTVAELEGYAAKTSGTIFAFAARILSRRAEESRDVTTHAGIAQGITNALRSLALHASRRQLFIPLDALGRYGAEHADIFAGTTTPELRAALAELRLLARHHLSVANERLAAAAPQIIPALLPAALLRPELARMERKSYQPFQVAEMPSWRNQWLLWRAARDPARIFGW